MTTIQVFIGGSRHMSRLPDVARDRLDNVIRARHYVLVGDAAGVDRAVQAHLIHAGHHDVTVFHSGDRPRHLLGAWRTESIAPEPGPRGFQVQAAKDRAMARYADFGLMIWDGQSPGTLLNVLRLVSSGKMTVLIDAPAGKTHTLKDSAEWRTFLADLSPATRTAIGRRAVGAERQWLAEAPTAGLFAHGAT